MNVQCRYDEVAMSPSQVKHNFLHLTNIPNAVSMSPAWLSALGHLLRWWYLVDISLPLWHAPRTDLRPSLTLVMTDRHAQLMETHWRP